MNKEKSKDLTVDQITDAKRLCDVIRGVPNSKRQVFELVMLAYLDPSANLTKALGLEPENETGAICEIFEKTMEFEDIPEGYGITAYEEGIDVITSSIYMHSVESKLNVALQREIVLRR